MPEHYDAEGKLINVGAKVWAAVDNNWLADATVVKLCPLTIRVEYLWGKSSMITKLLYPQSVVVRSEAKTLTTSGPVDKYDGID